MFTPYLGMTFSEVRESMKDTIRNGVAHLTPGQDNRVADYLDDLTACREVIPVLRYMAHVLIGQELKAGGT